jgi:hypothetical protein
MFPGLSSCMQSVHCAHFSKQENNYPVTVHKHSNWLIVIDWLLCMSRVTSPRLLRE